MVSSDCAGGGHTTQWANNQPMAPRLRRSPPMAGGHFQAVFVIPSSFHGYQGRGGGTVKPATYQFRSFPPTCATVSTVTAG
jgi:hypothetical protein